MNRMLLVSLVILATVTTNTLARNFFGGYKITKIHDQRPYKNQIDISITPNHYNCTTMSFTVGNSGLTEEHLNRLQSTALTAMLSKKLIGGLWSDSNEGCLGTTLYISD